MIEDLNSENKFEDIIEANKASLYRICRIYAVTPIGPEDLFQEVVYHIWKSLESYKGDAQLSTWIYRIAINVCMRYKLKLDKHNYKPMRSAITIQPGVMSENEEQIEKLTALRNCIQKLKEGDQSIVTLHLEGFDYKEISSIIGLTENHIAVKMKRIRKALFNCISPNSK